MMNEFSPAFIAAGGNEHPSAADADGSGVIAFGAGQNVALWHPDDGRGIRALLSGHTGVVNAVKFVTLDVPKTTCIISGAADNTVRIWKLKSEGNDDWTCCNVLEGHVKSVNAIAVLPGLGIFCTGAADSTLKFWKITANETGLDDVSLHVELLQTISTKSALIPMTLAAANIPDSDASVLAVGGSKTIVQIYASKSAHADFSLAATLSGHEGWIRALDFVVSDNKTSGHDDLLLASASQDKYIRLWRISQDQGAELANGEADSGALGLSRMLGGMSNKAHRFNTKQGGYSITFEALLLGHEDWVFSARWLLDGNRLKLLSASADNSLAVWEADESSGVWSCTVRLGEISAQKGATTATGSTGGFWLGLWHDNGRSVLSLGKTGSWRMWRYFGESDEWTQVAAVGGHTRPVNGVAWSQTGSYLLSTSSDKTTRLFAPTIANSAWHEFSRPQIHGYELNCIAVISDTRFISGADEKLLRVFDEPRAVAERLANACGITAGTSEELLEAANMPVLGLSNKAVESSAEDEGSANPDGTHAGVPVETVGFDTSQPPTEDQLARHLLWPETEKLYGHGYEICAAGVNNQGSLVATACRASSTANAAIRIYRTDDWQLNQPPLEAHSLTVTRLRFSPDGCYLLSVSRDRQCAVFEKTVGAYKLLPETLHKAHTRMILDATWLPRGLAFATAGRDKAVRIWRGQRVGNEATLQAVSTLSASSAVTAIDCELEPHENGIVLAYGLEDGSLFKCILSPDTLLPLGAPVQICSGTAPSKSVTQIAWRPHCTGTVAVASEDCSVRIFEAR